MLVGFNRQVEAGGLGQGAVVGGHFTQDAVVVTGVDHNGYVLMVFGCRADHGRAADVDILYCVGQGAVGIGDSLLKRIEVDHHHIDGVDAVLGHHRIVGTATAKDATVNFGVQSFDPAVHHFREAGVVGDFGNSDLIFLQHTEGAASG